MFILERCLRSDGSPPSDVLSLWGRASESVYLEFNILESQFQSSLTPFGERIEFKDLYFEVEGAFVCNLSKVKANCVTL